MAETAQRLRSIADWIQQRDEELLYSPEGGQGERADVAVSPGYTGVLRHVVLEPLVPHADDLHGVTPPHLAFCETVVVLGVRVVVCPCGRVRWHRMEGS